MGNKDANYKIRMFVANLILKTGSDPFQLQ